MKLDELKAKIAAGEAVLKKSLAADEERELREKLRTVEAAIREREETARFEEFSLRAVAPLRLGEIRLEPGQVIFRQIDLVTKRRIEAMTDGPEKSAAVEAEYRASIVYPDAQTLFTWELSYPGIMGDIVGAWGEHNSAVRRIRAGK